MQWLAGNLPGIASSSDATNPQLAAALIAQKKMEEYTKNLERRSNGTPIDRENSEKDVRPATMHSGITAPQVQVPNYFG